MHEMRKVVCSIYSEDLTQLRVIDSNSYSLDDSRIQSLNSYLHDRLECKDDSIEVLWLIKQFSLIWLYCGVWTCTGGCLTWTDVSIRGIPWWPRERCLLLQFLLLACTGTECWSCVGCRSSPRSLGWWQLWTRRVWSTRSVICRRHGPYPRDFSVETGLRFL